MNRLYTPFQAAYYLGVALELDVSVVAVIFLIKQKDKRQERIFLASCSRRKRLLCMHSDHRKESSSIDALYIEPHRKTQQLK